MFKFLFGFSLFLFCLNCQSDILRDDYSQYNGTYLDERDNGTLRKLNKLDKNSMAGHAVAPGAVRFTFGQAIPTVVCAILELTDIELESGESISSVQLGDGARWYVDVVKSGNENNLTEHLIVKPLDSGLKTSLIVTTDRRTYHIRLKSTADDFMQSVHFYYPKATFNQRSNIYQDTGNSFDYNLANTDKPYVNQKVSFIKDDSFKDNYQKDENTDFNKGKGFIYTVKNNLNNSISAYFNGRHTIISIRDNSLFEDEPVIFSMEKDSTFNKGKSPVNYRTKGNTYLVDGCFSNLLMQFTKGGTDYSVNIVR